MAGIYRTKGRAAEYAYLAIKPYRGCGHGCKYCYGPAVTRDQDFFRCVAERKDVLDTVRRQAPKLTGNRQRVLLSFITDPYQPLDDVTRTTRALLEILRQNKIPFTTLTKAGKRATRDLDLFGPDDMFGMTLTFIDLEKSIQVEPYAALPDDRITALKTAYNAGIRTWVSLEPVIDPAQSLELIRRTYKFVTHYKIGKLNHHKCTITAGQWRQFGIAAINLCRKYHVSYYIKTDLAAYLNGVDFENTDTRIV